MVNLLFVRGCYFDESTLPPSFTSAFELPRLSGEVESTDKIPNSQESRPQSQLLTSPSPLPAATATATAAATPTTTATATENVTPSESEPHAPSIDSRPRSPETHGPPTSESAAQPPPDHTSLRVDASHTLAGTHLKQRSSPISETSPNIADQHPTSPSSSVTSITAHTATLSPSKDTLPVESGQLAAKTTAEDTPVPEPIQPIISTTVEKTTEQPPQSIQQPLLKRENVEEGLQTELSSIAPHPAIPSEDVSSQKATQLPSDAVTSTDKQPSQPSTPRARPSTPSTGRKPVSPTRPVERMTTRVSSGAIRHKSVSEILGEKPKSQPSPTTKESKESAVSAPRWRSGEKQKKEKERSKLSTVIFPKQSPNQKGRFQGFQARHDTGPDGVRAPQNGASPRVNTLNEENDYLFTLFQAKAHLPPRSIHLNVLLSTAHKILSTSDHFVDYNEQMACRTLKRLYQLQSANRWPLRQLQRAREPRRQACHWDILLDHAKWMSTDFREERKWKIAVAKACAEWCKQYVEASPAEKATLRVNAHIPPHITKSTPPSSTDTNSFGDHPVPDLIASHEDDSIADDMSEDPHPDLSEDNVPAAIFSLGCDKFTFNMERTAASDAILGELPLYTPVQMDSKGEAPLFSSLPDNEWQTEILPVTKFAQGRLELPPRGPPRKKSRYQYYDSDDEDEDNDMDQPSIPPERGVISLFDHDSRLSRERLYPANGFRSPFEFPLPRQEFFDERMSSVWTPAEDEELRRLVKEYSFNWSLVASCLTHRSSQGWASPQCSSRSSSNFVAASERRTPWECFERWTTLEPLPVELARHPIYVKYRSMIDRSQQKISSVQQLAAQQQQAAGQPVPQSLTRRKTNVPISTEQSFSTRHIAELDAIRKLIKKREAIAQKQQHTNQVASQRKVNEVNQPKPPYSTPQEWARVKQERDQKLNEQKRQTLYAQQRAALAQRFAHSQQSHQQQLAQHAAAHIYQQQHGGLPQHAIPGMPPQLGATSMPAASHLASAGVPLRTPTSVPNGAIPRINGAHPGMIPAPAGAGPHHNLHGAVPPVMSTAAAAALAQQQRYLQGGAAAAMQASMANPVSGPDSAAMMMKMMPSAGLGIGNVNGLPGRPTIGPHTSPADNARILREATRLQEQQRLVQSRQQQQQNGSQAHHQFPHQTQPFLPQGTMSRTSPGFAAPKQANGNSRSPSMLGVSFPAAGKANSPPFHPSALIGHTSVAPMNSINATQHTTSPLFASASPHGNPAHSAAALAQGLPNIHTLQASIQRSNPKLTPEQAKKIATEKLHQFQQQRMSQLTLAGAVGNMNGMNPASFGQHNLHAVHANQHPHGHPNGQVGMRNPVPLSRPHTSPGDGAGDTNNMQRVSSQGHTAQGGTSMLPSGSHQGQGYSPLMRTVTTQAHAQVQPQRQFSPSYQQTATAGPKNMPNQNHVRPLTMAGPVPEDRARSMKLSPTPPTSSASPSTISQTAQQQMRRSASTHAAGGTASFATEASQGSAPPASQTPSQPQTK